MRALPIPIGCEKMKSKKRKRAKKPKKPGTPWRKPIQGPLARLMDKDLTEVCSLATELPFASLLPVLEHHVCIHLLRRRDAPSEATFRQFKQRCELLWDVLQSKSGYLDALVNNRLTPKHERYRKVIKGIENCRHCGDTQSAPLPVRMHYVDWILLPAGTWAIQDLIEHFRHFQSRFPQKRVEPNRLEVISGLNPADCYVGQAGWYGYVAFTFPYSYDTVLECPIYGNATYIIRGNWKEMSRLTRMQLRRQHPENPFVIHTGSWESKIGDSIRHNRTNEEAPNQSVQATE